jgi:glutamyl/glutaminyl-tRNA synthetase
MQVDEQFNIINDKLQQLLKQYNRVKKENELLRQKLEAQKKEQLQVEQEVELLKQKISVTKLSSGDMNEKDKKEFEKQINRYLKEIDKCIVFLST